MQIGKLQHAIRPRKTVVAMNHGDDCWIFRADDRQLAKAQQIFDYTLVVEGSGLFAVEHNDEMINAFRVAGSLEEFKQDLMKQYNERVKPELEADGYSVGLLFGDMYEFDVEADEIDIENPKHFVDAAIDEIKSTYVDRDSSSNIDLIQLPGLITKIHGQDPVIRVYDYELDAFLKEYED